MDERHLSSHWKHYLPLRTGFEPIEEPLLTSPLKRLERAFYPPPAREVWNVTLNLFARPSHGTWRAAKVLSVLRKHFTDYSLEPQTFIVIGDGAGALAILIRRFYPQATMYLVDFAPQLDTQLQNLHRYGGSSPKNAFIQPDDIDQINSNIDCAVNICSMQEMTPWAIAKYFAFLRHRSHSTSRFYCLNRVEKRLRGGEIIRFAEYPWQSTDEIFIDEKWPIDWFIDWVPPFYHRFDGEFRQRLTRLTA